MSSLRGRLYRLQWELRSQLSSFGLMDGIRLVSESDRWPRPVLDDLRDMKLRRAVAHAYEQSPHYRRMMDERGVRPADVRTVADLPKLPILTKEILREHRDELRARDFADDKDVEVGVTGGTTGNPMKVYRDRAGGVWHRALYWRGFSWGGLQIGEPWVQIFGGALGVQQMSARERVKQWFTGKLFLPAFELGSESAEAYIEAIRKTGARFLVGYASACHLLAKHVERSGRPLRFDAVFPTAELLPEAWAETIARVFGAKVLPYYGCGEVHSVAYSCPDAPKQTYHTCDEHAVVEVEGADGQARLEGEGAFLLSDLDNLAMPILRYRNGDAGLVAGPGCACGRSLGRIVRLDGRASDMLVTKSGETISGVIGVHAFRFVKGVKQFQLVQRRPGHARLRIVREPDYEAGVEAKLRGIFGKHLGGEDIEFEYVDDLPRTQAGKVRFVVNEYLDAQKAASAGPPPAGPAGGPTLAPSA